MKRIVIIGSDGQLGFDLMKTLPDPVGLTHGDVEVADPKSVEDALAGHKPDVVVNTAAYHRTDECEADPLKTFQVNALGAFNVAKAADKVGAEVVYISTDYVFDGGKKTPYIEEDRPNPINVYGASKLAGEHLTAIANVRHYIVRTSGLYGLTQSRKGHNFPDLMIKLAKERQHLKVVADEILTPTYTKDLAEKIAEVIEKGEYGVYHMTNQGECSWYEFAKKTLEYMGLKTQVIPAGPDDFPKKASRPPYSVLDNKHLRDAGLEDMRGWGEALKDYLKAKYGV